MAKIVWIDGNITPLEEAFVPVTDHAYLYGDGIFEGIRFYNGKVFKLDEHLARLYEGINYLDYHMEYSQEELKKIILETCAASGEKDGYIRVNVTRGTGLGLDPKHINLKPRVMVFVTTISLYPPELYAKGLDVITTSYRVIPSDSLNPRLKCIGRYAANILAKMEANRAGAGEGLMLNQVGNLAECTGDNIFIIKNNEIYTPHPSSGILQGITRDTVIMLAKELGYKVHETTLSKYDMVTADECFLTGTAAEVIAVATLDYRKVGAGPDGKITKEILKAFREHTKIGTPIPYSGDGLLSA